MKTLSKISMMGLLGTCILSLASCSKQEENIGILPSMSEIGIETPVTSVHSGFEPSYFIYENNVMKSGYDADLGEFEITENPLEIHVRFTEDEFDLLKMDLTDVETNAFGFITYAKIRYEDNGEDEPFVAQGYVKASYNADGYITRMEEVSNNPEESYKCILDFIWENGRLKEIDELYELNGEESSEILKYTFSYDRQIKNSGIYLLYELCDTSIPEFIYYSGLFGKTTKYVPTSVQVKGADGTVYPDLWTVETDNKGRIRKLFVNDSLEKVFAYDGDLAEYPYPNL